MIASAFFAIFISVSVLSPPHSTLEILDSIVVSYLGVEIDHIFNIDEAQQSKKI